METRAKPGVVEKMLDDLQWLGLTWDEGPYVQSERREFYRSIHQQLIAAGRIYLGRHDNGCPVGCIEPHKM